RLVGEEAEDWPDTQVKDNFACFKHNLEVSLREDIGGELFDKFLDECQKELGISKKMHAMKNPVVIGELIRRSESVGASCATLQAIITRIVALGRGQVLTPA